MLLARTVLTHGCGVMASMLGIVANAQTFTPPQVVYVDFDTRTDANSEHVYTPTERAAILAGVTQDYAGFGYAFTSVTPIVGDYSTIFVNSGNTGGLADQVDFRNLDPNDDAEVNVNGIFGGTGQPAATSQNFVAATTTLISHELGHLAGLQHGDSFGPIGSGLPTTGTPAPDRYGPVYPGPQAGDETVRNIMASPASVGISFSDLTQETSFSARSAVKLAFNLSGLVSEETTGDNDSAANAQPLTLPTIVVPNTSLPGDDQFGRIWTADAEVVTGSIATQNDQDYYAFTAEAGDLFEFQVLSLALDRVVDDVDPALNIFEADGTTLADYYGQIAFSDDDAYSLDAIFIDWIAPADSTYFLRVDSTFNFLAGTTGEYELFAYRFNSVPEPATLVLLGLAMPLILARRGRRSSHDANSNRYL